MARSDLVIDLVEAHRRGDSARFRVLVEAIIAEERSNQHHLVADRLSELITTSGSSELLTRDDAARQVADLVHEIVPRRRLATLQLAVSVSAAVAEIIEEHHRSELLRSHGIEPRNRILLEGAPGNGKTSLAEAIAAETMVPFYAVRYEGVVSSFLGETASRLDHVFEFARTDGACCSLTSSTRSPRNVLIHMRRARSSGLSPRCFCRLIAFRPMSSWCARPTTGNSLTAPHGAGSKFVWSSMPLPGRRRLAFLETLRSRLGGELGLAPRTLADKLAGASYAELEQFAQDVRRRYVLSLPDANLDKIVRSRLEQWRTQVHH